MYRLCLLANIPDYGSTPVFTNPLRSSGAEQVMSYTGTEAITKNIKGSRRTPSEIEKVQC
jgi:hypothetical protein